MSKGDGVVYQIGQRCWKAGWWLLLWGFVLSFISGTVFAAVGDYELGIALFYFLFGVGVFMLSVAPILIIIGWVVPANPAIQQEREERRARERAQRQEQERERAEQERRKQAAEQGNAEEQFNRGTCFFFGRGVPEDKAEGMRWYRKAAMRGHVEAQYNLGMCYFYGYSVIEDKDEGIKWFCQAAEQGHAKAREELRQMGIN